jgi:DNA-binding beta-propeller fold protein YncE
VRSLVTADNSLLYVSNFNGNSVSIYSIDDGKLIETVPVGARPDALALNPSEQYLLVIDSGSGDVAVVRNDGDVKPPRKSFILFTMIPVGLDPRQIVVKAFMLRKPPE